MMVRLMTTSGADSGLGRAVTGLLEYCSSSLPSPHSLCSLKQLAEGARIANCKCHVQLQSAR